MRTAVLLAIFVACGEPKRVEPAPPPKLERPKPVEDMLQCEALPFADSTPVPEASAAAWLDGKLVVTSDSGNHGAYGIVDPDTGATVEQGTWPLGDGNDDVEGLATRGDLVYGLTSAGYMHVWKRAANGFELVDGPYPIGDGEMVCKPSHTNCKRNYEGLCLAAKPSKTCAGYALSKEDGALYCLVEEHGKFVVKQDLAIPISGKGVLADCAFDDQDRLWVGANVFEINDVYRIDGWMDPKTAKVVAIGSVGVGFSEVIAVHGDTVYRMSDTGGSPSSMAKFRCSPVGR